MYTEKDIKQLQILVVFNDNKGKAVGLSPLAGGLVTKLLGLHMDENGNVAMYSDEMLSALLEQLEEERKNNVGQ